MKISTFTSAALALVMSTGIALAQTAPTPPAQPSTTVQKIKKSKTVKKTKAAVKAQAARSAASIACSTEANSKGLHGKERKKFRKICLAGKAKAAKAN